ncbi:sulfite exporter TauE/SafE family protein [candidate division WWE3 bacterium]|jgi:uncharacterized membrane protein YfcA|uniref:Probable membrane transporter protein n=1 Tax=candidate division WWE3 bacterium TaxID=2053526 RepID=A0A3A4ZFE5_UNCKA|nr:MAG: sulfite exporter TauE/SafE family protein [candidate division WWE3 bacterium]
MFDKVAIFLIGFVSGFLGSTVGGGGFVSIPALLYLGFTPQSAIALNKIGDVGTFISAVRKYWKSKKIDWNLAGTITCIYIIGSFLGTKIMVLLNANVLEILVYITIALALPLLVFKRDLGIKKVSTSKLKKSVGYILLFLLSIIGAVIGAGGAVVSTIVMIYFFGFEIVKGHATTTPSKFFSASIPAVIYYYHGFIPIIPGIMIFTGMLLGGLVGASFAVSAGNKWIKTFLLGVICFFILYGILNSIYMK